MRRRDEQESDDSVLVSSDEDEELSGDEGDDRSGEDGEDGYGSLEDELEALAAARAERGITGEEEDEDDDDNEDNPNPSSRLASARDRPPTYDAGALRDALEDVRWQPEADWAEGRAITSARGPGGEPLLPGAAVDDDLARELAFYRQALAAARAVAASADAAGAAWSRPHDFYAEMVKSDGHMRRVRAQMEHERSSVEAAGAARQAREAKKFSKEVSAERRREKSANKKQATEGVAKLRADRQRGGFSGELDADAALEALEKRGGFNNSGGRGGGGGGGGERSDGGGRGGGFGRGRGGGDSRGGGRSGGRGGGRGQQALGQRISRDGGKEQGGKRAFKDAKYGRGGRANSRGSRQNDAASAADTRDFRPGKFTEHFSARRGGGVSKGGRGGRSGGRGGGGGSSSRPGKNKRASTRGGR